MRKQSRTCTKCKKKKELTAFGNNKRINGGKHFRCKDCEAKRRKENKQYFWLWNLAKKYNITLEDYKFMSDIQEGVCAICKKKCLTGNKLAVDHCHKTGRVRGLLCTVCNTSLGGFKDNVSLLESAILYLKINGGTL
jgi:hypothetical protein